MAEAPAPEPASPPGELAPPVAEPAPDAGEGAPAALATPEPAPAEPTPPPASVPAPDEHIVAEGGAAGERDAAEPRGEGAASGQELDRAPAVSADGDQEVELLEDDFFEPEIIQVERVSGGEPSAGGAACAGQARMPGIRGRSFRAFCSSQSSTCICNYQTSCSPEFIPCRLSLGALWGVPVKSRAPRGRAHRIRPAVPRR